MQKSLFDTLASYSAIQTIMQPGTLWLRDSAGGFAPADGQAILRAARAIADEALPRSVVLDKPQAVRDFFRLMLNESMEHEVLGMALLNSQFELIEYLEPFRGTLNQAAVYPREIVKIALKANAGA